MRERHAFSSKNVRRPASIYPAMSRILVPAQGTKVFCFFSSEKKAFLRASS